jgi:hypothetical protein
MNDQPGADSENVDSSFKRWRSDVLEACSLFALNANVSEIETEFISQAAQVVLKSISPSVSLRFVLYVSQVF